MHGVRARRGTCKCVGDAGVDAGVDAMVDAIDAVGCMDCDRDE
jgi:hypothetical protein